MSFASCEKAIIPQWEVAWEWSMPRSWIAPSVATSGARMSNRSVRSPASTQTNRFAGCFPYHAIYCTHWLRQAGASKGSAKYCVSCTTLPLRNSIMLTVYAGRP